MVFPTKREIIISVLPILSVGVLGFMILFISLSRASLESATLGDVENNHRTIPVEYVHKTESGEKLLHSYKLPAAEVLPNSYLYGFKQGRDFLWLTFSSGPVKKSQIALLIADKKLSETIELLKLDQNTAAIEAGSEALDKLKYADALISDINRNAQVDHLHLKITEAGLAYEEILRSSVDRFKNNENKYNNLLNDLIKWNESQKEEQKEKNRN